MQKSFILYIVIIVAILIEMVAFYNDRVGFFVLLFGFFWVLLVLRNEDWEVVVVIGWVLIICLKDYSHDEGWWWCYFCNTKLMYVD